MDTYHQPVLVQEVLEYLAPEAGGVYLDATVGGGGHAEAILSSGEDFELLGTDRDPEAIEAASRRLDRFGSRVRLRQGDFADAVDSFDLGEGTLAGVLLDLGVSSHQIDELERGFSFRPGAPLDMRMAAGSAGGESAADLLNRLEADELADLFRRYGEVRGAGRLAGAIVEQREAKPLQWSEDLVAAVESVRRGRATASRLAPIFQALRIAVNRELESLERALPTFRDALAPNGRLVVIAYHSLEDRIVKHTLREWSKDCICPPELPICRCRGRALGRHLTRRPVRPNPDEVAANPRARSARLRAWKKASADGSPAAEGER